MTDKERILMVIVQRVIPGLHLDPAFKSNWVERSPDFMGSNYYLQPGDLVIASTTQVPNEFMVGFVDTVISSDEIAIREIGSNRVVRYSNESFIRLNKEKLGYNILEGLQYITYQKVRKAFYKYCDEHTRFKSISFNENICTVEARLKWERNTVFTVSFPYNSKTTIKKIGELLTAEEAKCSS